MSLILPPHLQFIRNEFKTGNVPVGTPTKVWVMADVELNNVTIGPNSPSFFFRFGANNSGCTMGFAQVGGAMYGNIGWRTSVVNPAGRRSVITANTRMIMFSTYDRDVASDGSFSQGRIRYWFDGVEGEFWDITGHGWHGGTSAQPTIGGDSFPADNRTYKIHAAAAGVGGILTPAEIEAFQPGDDLTALSFPPTWMANLDGLNGMPAERVLDVLGNYHAPQVTGGTYPMSSTYPRFESATQPDLPIPVLGARTARQATLTVTPTVGAGSIKVVVGAKAANVTPPTNAQITNNQNQDGSAILSSETLAVSSTDPVDIVVDGMAPDVEYSVAIHHNMDGAGDYSNVVRGFIRTKRLMAIDSLEKTPGVDFTGSMSVSGYDNILTGTRLFNLPSVAITDGAMSLNLSSDLAASGLDLGDTIDLVCKFSEESVGYSVAPTITLSDPA